MNNQENESFVPPIIVLGVPRSGTTLVARYLKSVKGISGLTAYTEWASAQRWLPCSSAARIGQLFAANGATERFYNGGRIWDEALRQRDMTFATRLEKIMCLGNPNARAWVIKKISNVLNIPNLLELFPKSVAVVVYRDPVDTILSIYERRQKKCGTASQRWGVFPDTAYLQSADPIIDCAIQYEAIDRIISQSLGMFSQTVRINYREFCGNPSRLLEALEPAIGTVAHPRFWLEETSPRTRNATPDQVAKIRSVLGHHRLGSP